jgi:hypothetical protein
MSRHPEDSLDQAVGLSKRCERGKDNEVVTFGGSRMDVGRWENEGKREKDVSGDIWAHIAS